MLGLKRVRPISAAGQRILAGQRGLVEQLRHPHGSDAYMLGRSNLWADRASYGDVLGDRDRLGA